MANEPTEESHAAADPLSSAERSRLTQCFQRGQQNADANVDYAIEMFATCVREDPASAVYLQHLLGALKMKFVGKRPGGLSAVWAIQPKAKMRKAASAAQWLDVLATGLEILKKNPFDHGCLLAMAEACGNMLYLEPQRTYLKAALDAAPNDVEVNRQCARFLADRGEFDQAIACWVRVSTNRSVAEEAQKEIARLQVEKTIVAGRGKRGGDESGGKVTPADRLAGLQARHAEDPSNIDVALELADLLEREATAEQAEKVLTDTLAASGNDLKVREHLEDRQMRWARQRVLVAEKRYAEQKSEPHQHSLERLRRELLKLEIDVYAARAARYPENITWKYELALRLKQAGKFAEAIQHFQEVLQDPRRQGLVALELGECFQKIKQYPLAMQNYTLAVNSLSDREIDHRKRALYRAGVLATGLNDHDAARKHLSTLAGLDFGYRDVATRLDKLSGMGDN